MAKLTTDDLLERFKEMTLLELRLAEARTQTRLPKPVPEVAILVHSLTPLVSRCAKERYLSRRIAP